MSSGQQLPRGGRAWAAIGWAMTAGVVLYYGFVAVNTWALPEHTGTATVLEKNHYAARIQYESQNIGGRNSIVPVEVPETYVLQLRLNDRETTAWVDKPLYDSLNARDQVNATYQYCRLTGALQIVRISSGEGQRGG